MRHLFFFSLALYYYVTAEDPREFCDEYAADYGLSQGGGLKPDGSFYYPTVNGCDCSKWSCGSGNWDPCWTCGCCVQPHPTPPPTTSASDSAVVVVGTAVVVGAVVVAGGGVGFGFLHYGCILNYG
jgi:hypothetical protein